MLVSLLLLRTALHDPKEHDIQGSCCSNSRTPSTPALRLSSRSTARRARGGGPRNSAARAALQARGLTLACMLRVHAVPGGAIFPAATRSRASSTCCTCCCSCCSCSCSRTAGSCSCCSRSRCSSSRCAARARARVRAARARALARAARRAARASRRSRPLRRPRSSPSARRRRTSGGARRWGGYELGLRRSAAAHRLGAELCAGGGRASGAAPNRRATPDAALAAADAVAGTNLVGADAAVPVRDGGAALVGPRVGKRAAATKVYTRARRRAAGAAAAPPGRPPPLPPAAVTAALLRKPSAPCDLKCGGCSSMVAATLPRGSPTRSAPNATPTSPPTCRRRRWRGGRPPPRARRRRAPRCRSARWVYNRCFSYIFPTAKASSTPPTTTRAPAGVATGWAAKVEAPVRRFACGWPSARRWTRTAAAALLSPPARRRQTRQRRRRIRTLGWEAS